MIKCSKILVHNDLLLKKGEELIHQLRAINPIKKLLRSNPEKILNLSPEQCANYELAENMAKAMFFLRAVLDSYLKLIRYMQNNFKKGKIKKKQGNYVKSHLVDQVYYFAESYIRSQRIFIEERFWRRSSELKKVRKNFDKQNPAYFVDAKKFDNSIKHQISIGRIKSARFTFNFTAEGGVSCKSYFPWFIGPPKQDDPSKADCVEMDLVEYLLRAATMLVELCSVATKTLSKH